MKTKIMKKLISVVCALAIATSCVSVSVGAVPVTTAQVDWAKGYNRASELVEHADEVRSNGHLVSESNALADAIEEFLNGAEYNTLFSEISDEKKDDLVHCIYTHLEPENHYKVGDPFPILYRIYKKNKYGYNHEVVDSMPFPLPLQDVFSNANAFYHSA